MGVLLGVEQSCLNFARVCLPSLVNATFKNLMHWRTCFLSLLYKNVVLRAAALGCQIFHKFNVRIFSIFCHQCTIFFPLFLFHQFFAWSFCSFHLQAMGKRYTNSNSLNGGDLPKGCRGTLDHVQGSPQGRNILFCHTHKAMMPSSQ